MLSLQGQQTVPHTVGMNRASVYNYRTSKTVPYSGGDDSPAKTGLFLVRRSITHIWQSLRLKAHQTSFPDNFGAQVTAASREPAISSTPYRSL